MLDEVNWVIVGAFWLPISVMIWKAWAKSEAMGTVGFRLFAIIAMLPIITVIVWKMGDN